MDGLILVDRRCGLCVLIFAVSAMHAHIFSDVARRSAYNSSRTICQTVYAENTSLALYDHL